MTNAHCSSVELFYGRFYCSLFLNEGEEEKGAQEKRTFIRHASLEKGEEEWRKRKTGLTHITYGQIDLSQSHSVDGAEMPVQRYSGKAGEPGDRQLLRPEESRNGAENPPELHGKGSS